MSKLDKSDIISMIKDKNSLPMYDVINDTILLIPHNKIYYNFTKNYLRILDNNVLKKLKLNVEIDETEITSRFYKIIYDNHPMLGKQITFCKKPYFLYFINYNNNPYYTKSELHSKNKFFSIKGDNDETICKKLQKVELSKDDITKSFKYITQNNNDRILKYYSFIGAAKINDYLRGIKSKIDSINKNIILKMDSIIKDSPNINKDQIVFRFLSDDTFLKTQMENNIFIDKGFVSTTRNPMMENANLNFGKIMMRIYIPKKHSNKFISIESISLFSYEQEIIIARGAKFKLLKQHKIDNIKIYDFELIDIIKKENIDSNDDTHDIDIKYFQVDNSLESVYNDWSYYTTINFRSDNINEKFYIGYTKEPKALKRFFYFKKKILYLYKLDKNGNIELFIELSDTNMFINYFMKFFGHSKKETISEYITRNKIISNIAFMFKVNNVYINTIQLPGYIINKNNLSNNQICFDYYNMIKNNDFNIQNFLKMNFPIYYIKSLKKFELKSEYLLELPSLKIFSDKNKLNNLSDLYIAIVNKQPSLMIEFYNLCFNYFESFNNPFNKDYYILDHKNMIFTIK